MATTKIWDVSAHVSKLLAYVANKNKTVMEIENKNFDEAERLAAEILGLLYDHFATEEKKFVTGINCTPENANEVMLTLLEDTDSSDIQAYLPILQAQRGNTRRCTRYRRPACQRAMGRGLSCCGRHPYRSRTRTQSLLPLGNGIFGQAVSRLQGNLQADARHLGQTLQGVRSVSYREAKATRS